MYVICLYSNGWGKLTGEEEKGISETHDHSNRLGIVHYSSNGLHGVLLADCALGKGFDGVGFRRPS